MILTLGTKYEYTSRTVTAMNEPVILEWMGKWGWEMIDIGPSSLYFQRPRDRATIIPWVYARLTAVLGDRGRQEMRAQGWEPAGDWVLFHYFKRPHSAPLTGGEHWADGQQCSFAS